MQTIKTQTGRRPRFEDIPAALPPAARRHLHWLRWAADFLAGDEHGILVGAGFWTERELESFRALSRGFVDEVTTLLDSADDEHDTN